MTDSSLSGEYVERILSMQHAARCLTDHERTAVFVRGLYHAIQELKQRFPGERLDILYAGTGPLATLAISVAAKLTPEEVNFTFLDQNPRSLGVLRQLLFKSEFREIFDVDIFNDQQYIHADARTFKTDRKFHLVLSETMSSALLEEQYPEIAANLAKYLHEGGILLPEEVVVSLDAPVSQGVHKPFGEVVKIDRNFTGNLDVDTEIPLSVHPDIGHVMLATRVRVFGEDVLLSDRSDITRNICIPVDRGSEAIRVSYRLGCHRNGLKIRVLRASDLRDVA